MGGLNFSALWKAIKMCRDSCPVANAGTEVSSPNSVRNAWLRAKWRVYSWFLDHFSSAYLFLNTSVVFKLPSGNWNMFGGFHMALQQNLNKYQHYHHSWNYCTKKKKWVLSSDGSVIESCTSPWLDQTSNVFGSRNFAQLVNTVNVVVCICFILILIV